MQYIVLIGTEFDEDQMKTALKIMEELTCVDFICMSGWIRNSKGSDIWKQQEKWLIDNGVVGRDISCPARIGLGVSVYLYGQAVTIFDQMVCASYMTTDDIFSKGELFFVGPEEYKTLTLELAKFLRIPRQPSAERCEYHPVATRISKTESDLIQPAIEVLLGKTRVYSRFLPRTARQRRKKVWRWLEENCV